MSYPLTTTLNRIWACNPCAEGKKRALKAAGKDAPDDEPITFAQIAEAVGLNDALWCCQAEPQHSKEWRLFAIWCARQVQHLITDDRSIAALDVAERHANGEASDEELAAARAAAEDAARAAEWAAWAAWAAAWDAALAAAGGAARAAALAAARDAAGGGAWAAQHQAFIQLVTTGTLPAITQQEVVG
jgi:hypothetical protein